MKAKKLIVLTLLAMLLLSTFACEGGAEEEATPTQLPYSDDFSSSTSGWDTFADEDGRASYEGGWLHVTTYTAAGFATYSCAHQHFTDFILEVETKLVAGTDDNWHQIVCRYLDDNYYDFDISADGYYGILAWIQGSRHVLVEPTSSIHILQGRNATNRVRVECVGSTLSLSVNGHLLVEVTDARLHGGDICLGVSSLAGTFSEVAFDNIVVTAP